MARRRIVLDALTPNRCAAARHDNPPSMAPTTRLGGVVSRLVV
jgi:hypothetical protein